MIKQNKNHFPIKMMCKILCVSSSGYYDWQNRKPSKRSEEKIQLTAEIKRIFDEEKSRVGSIRITKRLQDNGKIVGKNRVAKIMRENKWRAKAARKFKATTNSNHSLPVGPNLLQKNFSASKPNEKWASDISVPQQAA